MSRNAGADDESIRCPECGEANMAADVRCWACDAELHPVPEPEPPAEPYPPAPAPSQSPPTKPTPEEMLALTKVQEIQATDQGLSWPNLIAVGMGGLSFVASLMASLVFEDQGLPNPFFFAPFLRFVALGSLAFSIYAWRKGLHRSSTAETSCFLTSCFGCLGLLTVWAVVGYWMSH